LNHFKVWGCPAEVRLNNPTLGKLEAKTTRCYFVSYSEYSKGYRFYNPSGGTRIVESQTAKFLEFDVAEKHDCSQISEHDNMMRPVMSFSLPVQTIMEPTVPRTEHVNTENPIDETATDEVLQVPQTQNEVIVAPLRRSTREKAFSYTTGLYSLFRRI